MPGSDDRKHRLVTRFQRYVANPLNRRLPFQILLETTGRTSGLTSQYVRNIQADPAVRVRIAGRWHHGTAHLLPDDDAVARLRTLPRFNSAAVRAFGTDLLTVRVDLAD
jgi:hypothetical protein